MKKLHQLWLSLTLLPLTPCSLHAEDTSDTGKKRPNILFILTDDMGWGDLSCYGSRQIKTPAIDALAANGVRFTQAYVSANVCAPSRAGILTGRYQERFGFEHNVSHWPKERAEHLRPEKEGIPLDEKLISDRLKKLGYYNGIIGKWHVGHNIPEFHPLSRGFDFFFGMLKGRHHYFPDPKANELNWGRGKVNKVRTPYLTDWFTLEAMDFITRASRKEAPWFLFLSYNTPHSPLQAKPDDIAAFAHIKNEKRRIYCAMQKSLDDNIHQLVTYLKKQNLLDDTLLVFLNDNGGSVEVSHAVNAPLNGTKGTWYEGGIRVPMIIHWPEKIPAGKTYHPPVISFDIMHTLVAAAGGEVKEETVKRGKITHLRPRDGVDLLPYINGTRQGKPHNTLYWRMTLRGGAIREGNWKMIMTPHRPTMLFDLSKDPSELTNLATTEPGLVKKLYKKYHDWCETFERNPMWISPPKIADYNDKLYDLSFPLEQPE